MSDLSCPQCQQSLDFDYSIEGALVKCTHCGLVFRAVADSQGLLRGEPREDLEMPREAPPASRPASWQSITLGVLGIHWALSYLVPALSYGASAPLGFLPLLGFAAPFLARASRRWRNAAIWLCIFEICLSPILLLSTTMSYMDPLGLQVRVFGFLAFSLTSARGILGYFVFRALAFVWAVFLIRTLPAPDPGEQKR